MRQSAACRTGWGWTASRGGLGCLEWRSLAGARPSNRNCIHPRHSMPVSHTHERVPASWYRDCRVPCPGTTLRHGYGRLRKSWCASMCIAVDPKMEVMSGRGRIASVRHLERHAGGRQECRRQTAVFGTRVAARRPRTPPLGRRCSKQASEKNVPPGERKSFPVQ